MKVPLPRFRVRTLGVAVATLFLSSAAVAGPARWLDEAAEVGAKASAEAARAAKAARLARLTTHPATRAAASKAALTAAAAGKRLARPGAVPIYVTLADGGDDIVAAVVNGTVEFFESADDFSRTIATARPGTTPLDFFVDRSAMPNDPAWLQSMTPEDRIFWVDNGKPLQAVKAPASDGLLVEPFPRVLVPTTDYDRLSTLTPLLGRPFRAARVQLFSFFDPTNDTDTLRHLARTAKKSGIQVAPTTSRDLGPMLRSARGGVVALVGHVEHGKFVVRSARNEIVDSFEIDWAQTVAQEHGVMLVHVGCETAARGTVTGFLDELQSLEIVDRVVSAAKSPTYSEFFSRLGTPESPIVLSVDDAGTHRFMLNAMSDAKQSSVQQGLLVSLGVRQQLTLPGRTSALIIQGMAMVVMVLGMIVTGVLCWLGGYYGASPDESAVTKMLRAPFRIVAAPLHYGAKMAVASWRLMRRMRARPGSPRSI